MSIAHNTHMHTTHTCTHACTCTQHTHAHTHAHMHACTCTQHTHAHMHAHAHNTHMHAHIAHTLVYMYSMYSTVAIMTHRCTHVQLILTHTCTCGHVHKCTYMCTHVAHTYTYTRLDHKVYISYISQITSNTCAGFIIHSPVPHAYYLLHSKRSYILDPNGDIQHLGRYLLAPLGPLKLDHLHQHREVPEVTMATLPSCGRRCGLRCA